MAIFSALVSMIVSRTKSADQNNSLQPAINFDLNLKWPVAMFSLCTFEMNNRAWNNNLEQLNVDKKTQHDFSICVLDHCNRRLLLYKQCQIGA